MKILCSCGVLLYNGAPPAFSRIGCPICKKTTEVRLPESPEGTVAVPRRK